MLYRISSAALAVFIAAIFAAAPIGAGRAEAQAERAATSTAPANPRDGLRATQPGATLQQATTSISCNNSNGTITTYTLSVGGGTCLTAGGNGSGGTAGRGVCAGSGTDEAEASCLRGCIKTAGDGSCRQTTN